MRGPFVCCAVAVFLLPEFEIAGVSNEKASRVFVLFLRANKNRLARTPCKFSSAVPFEEIEPRKPTICVA